MASLEHALEFTARADVAALRALIAPSLPAIRRGLAERGLSAPISLVANNLGTTPSREALLTLVKMRKAGELDELEFWYVLTAIELHLVATDRRDSVLGNLVSDLAERELVDAELRRVEIALRSLPPNTSLERTRER